MREFKSLKPKNIPDGFDLEVHTEEPIVDVKEAKGRIIVNYAFPGFYIVDDNQKVAGKKMNLKSISIKSTGFLKESGKPLLPSFGRYVQIPQGSKYKVKVEKTKPIEFNNILISPAQTLLSDNPAQKHELEYNKAFYSKDILYPKEIVKVTGPLLVDQYHALLVHVTPLQYNPAKKKIIGYGNITLNIEIQEIVGGGNHVTDTLIENEAFGNLILNPGQEIAERVGFKIRPVNFKAIGPELIIIYAKVFEKAALRLSDWKNHRGLLTETVCIDTIGNDVNKIKSYIRNKRKQLFSRLRYVLLFGDEDMIATQKDLQSLFGAIGFLPAGDRHCATDYYYSTQYDEHTPDPARPNALLFYPWLSVGRISVRPDTEGPPASGDLKAQGAVDQIIAYEKNPPANPMYYKRQVFAAAFEDDSRPHNQHDDRGYLRTIEEIASAIEALGYTVERIYVSNDTNPQFYENGTSISAEVKSAIVAPAVATQMLVDATSEGQLYIGHRDHGNWNGWVNPSFRSTDLDRVTGDVPSIFYSINCETGGLDYAEPTECWAEKNLRMKGTAPSLIASTRDSGTFRNNDLIKAIYDATFGGVLTTFPGGNASYPVRYNRLGDILNYGKSYLPVVNSGDDRGVKDHFEIYHVIGDPTLELWKDLPLTITLKAKITNKALEIQLSACPKDSVITLWYADKMLKRMVVTSNHITIPTMGLIPVKFPRPIFPRPFMSVCFWAPGYRYAEVKVVIGIPELVPHLVEVG